MDLRDVREEVEAEIESEFLLVASYPQVSEISESFEQLSALNQAAAICQFLETTETSIFIEHLTRSACVRRYYLQRCRDQQNVGDRRLAISRSEGVLDALIAGRLSLAADIAQLSIRQWVPQWEYEDDFLFFHFVHQLIREYVRSEDARVAETIDRYAVVIQDDESATRFDACAALVMRDEQAFVEAIVKLMEEKAELDETNVSRLPVDSIRTLLFWPRRFVAIQGLALLRICELLGMSAPADIQYCPDQLRSIGLDDTFDDVVQQIANLPRT